MTKIQYLAVENGSENSIDNLIEEMAELIVTLKQFKRGRKSVTDIVQEMADVRVCCQQVQINLAINDDQLNKMEQYKVDRQIARFKGGIK